MLYDRELNELGRPYWRNPSVGQSLVVVSEGEGSQRIVAAILDTAWAEELSPSERSEKWRRLVHVGNSSTGGAWIGLTRLLCEELYGGTSGEMWRLLISEWARRWTTNRATRS